MTGLPEGGLEERWAHELAMRHGVRVVRLIGSGGMGKVYLGTRLGAAGFEKPIVIKRLAPHLAHHERFREELVAEAKIMVRLNHPNIVQVFDLIAEQGEYLILLEHIEGHTLRELISCARHLGTPPPIELAVAVVTTTLQALDYAHGLRDDAGNVLPVIHCDICPDNLMVSRRGVVKLMDFGIARHERFGDLTETDTGLGTPSYMSPEQILGDKLDFRSDIFSVGIVLYQMLTGRKPFVEDDTRTVMQKIRLDRYEPFKKLGVDVPRKLERIMARCLQKMPANRYPTTQALIDDLTEFLAPRVAMNHNARLVMYLYEIGIMTGEQTDEVLSAVAPRALRNARRDGGFLRSIAKKQALVLLALLASGITVQAASGRWSGPVAGGPSGFVNPAEAGHLKVSVDPWAHVDVDGERVLTTPAARAIPLKPGRHFVTYTNPYFAPVEHEVLIEAGKTLHDRATLSEPRNGDAEDTP